MTLGDCGHLDEMSWAGAGNALVVVAAEAVSPDDAAQHSYDKRGGPFPSRLRV
jgi:hypothetical protein